MISVVIVDDQHLVRAGIRALLERADDIEVVGEGVDGESGLRAVVQFRPDVVLMDIRMPGLDGVAATRRIPADPRLADVAVVVLTTFDADEHVFEAIRAGARGFLLKDTEPDDLRRAVRVVAGRRVVALARGDRPGDAARPRGYAVAGTRRAAAAADPAGAGGAGRGGRRADRTTRSAARLQMSAATARTHVSRVMTKLGARDRAQLVVHRLRVGSAHPRRRRVPLARPPELRRSCAGSARIGGRAPHRRPESPRPRPAGRVVSGAMRRA